MITAVTESVSLSESVSLKDVDRALILQALEAAGWMIGGREGAAARLGLKRTTLPYKMKKFGIYRPGPGRKVNAPREALQQAESLATM